VALVSLSEAREKAQKLRKIAREGGDPLTASRKQRKVVPTFERAARLVHESHSASFRNEKHRKQWLSSLTNAFTILGAVPVDQISTPTSSQHSPLIG
jgi:hypothetical protein